LGSGVVMPQSMARSGHCHATPRPRQVGAIVSAGRVLVRSVPCRGGVVTRRERDPRVVDELPENLQGRPRHRVKSVGGPTRGAGSTGLLRAAHSGEVVLHQRSSCSPAQTASSSRPSGTRPVGRRSTPHGASPFEFGHAADSSLERRRPLRPERGSNGWQLSGQLSTCLSAPPPWRPTLMGGSFWSP
jgi:hypothetical protein